MYDTTDILRPAGRTTAGPSRNVVLVHLVNSMVEFKQIVGRGTRVRDDYGKLWFNILDHTAEKVRTLCAGLDDLRARRADAGHRADEQLRLPHLVD